MKKTKSTYRLFFLLLILLTPVFPKNELGRELEAKLIKASKAKQGAKVQVLDEDTTAYKGGFFLKGDATANTVEKAHFSCGEEYYLIDSWQFRDSKLILSTRFLHWVCPHETASSWTFYEPCREPLKMKNNGLVSFNVSIKKLKNGIFYIKIPNRTKGGC